jgi:hypothetical protein
MGAETQIGGKSPAGAGRAGEGVGHLREGSRILDSLVEAEQFVEFLTLPAYPYLE